MRSISIGVGRLLFLLLLTSFAARSASLDSEKRNAPEISISNLERRVHDLINDERAHEQIKTLDVDERLTKIARTHSLDMVRRRFFSHVNPDGQDPTARGKRAGYVCHKVSGNVVTDGLGENLFQGNRYDSVRIRGAEKVYDWNSLEDIARQSISGWMKSPGHRRNILEKNYTRTGVGIAIAPDDKVYVTQLFC